MRKIVLTIILIFFISGCAGYSYQAYPTGEEPEYLKKPQNVIIQKGDS